MSKPIRIAREGVELGSVDPAEVQALLATGFLKPTDDFWRAGMADWRPLSEFQVEMSHRPSVSGSDWNVGERIRSMAGSAGKLARRLKEAAKTGSDSVAKAQAQALEDYLPQLRQLVATRFDQAAVRADAAFKDDEMMKKVFGAVFDCLPRPVTRFLAEDQFVKFCMKHRESLVRREETSEKSGPLATQGQRPALYQPGATPQVTDQEPPKG